MKNLTTSNSYSEIIKRAITLSESGDYIDRMIAALALSLDPGAGISRTAENRLRQLENDESKDVSNLASHIISNVKLMK